MKQKVKLSKEYKIDSLRNLLSKYSSFKQCLREIKIGSLIGQRSQFDIEDLKPPILISIDDSNIIYTNVYKSSLIQIKSFSVIIEVDQTISEIKIVFDIIGKDKDYMSTLFEQNLVDVIPTIIFPSSANEFITGFNIKLKEIK